MRKRLRKKLHPPLHSIWSDRTRGGFKVTDLHVRDCDEYPLKATIHFENTGIISGYTYTKDGLFYPPLGEDELDLIRR